MSVSTSGCCPAASLRAESAGAYRIERALSEGASSLSAQRPRAPHADTRAHAWLLLAQLCLRSHHTIAIIPHVSCHFRSTSTYRLYT